MKGRIYLLLVIAAFSFGCSETKDCEKCDELDLEEEIESNESTFEIVDSPSLVILGTIQDAGSPQINCHKECCEQLHDNPDLTRMVVSIGIVDPENQKKYILEASPDMSEQLADLSQYENFSDTDIPDGVFLTHAHIGHYTGLMDFGKEAISASDVPVYAMPRMKEFLSTNGPWDQLVTNKNITIHDLKNEEEVVLTTHLKIVPFTVPHRDEYSETVGFKIIGPNKSALFIPDIDKWDKWEKDIVEEVAKVDYAFLDATFYDFGELGDRDMNNVPHPLITQTIELFRDQEPSEKSKIYFIHFNHTNPILNSQLDAKIVTTTAAFNVAQKGLVLGL
ncbi:MAG: pyrroloquinoline quinone biosynthesis protein B [Arenicella sp.]|jgi:pyrroloquinoline quinone biosynthesis protein B